MSHHRYWVYMMSGAGKTLYIGLTNNLMRRVWEHKTHSVRGFTSKYNLDRLVYYAEFSTPAEAIAHEKRLKGWVRRKKDALIHAFNPDGCGLATGWFDLAPQNDIASGDSSVALPTSGRPLLQNDSRAIAKHSQSHKVL